MSDLTVEVRSSVTEVNENQWNNVVQHSVTGSVFVSYSWLRAFEQSTDLKGRHIIAYKGNNPVGILPGFIESIHRSPVHRLNSSAAGFACPVIVGNEDEVLPRLFERVSTLCSGRTLFHRFKPASGSHLRYARFFQDIGYESILSNCRIYIDLSKDWEIVKDGMDSSKRNKINGLDRGYEVFLQELSKADIGEFYDRHTSNMERHGGSDIDREFLEHASTGFSNTLKLATGYHRDQVIGQYLYILDNSRSTIQHFMSAVDPDQFKYNPGELLHSHMIQWGIDSEYDFYDFGGTAADWNDGVFQYKIEFGGRLRPTVEWHKSRSSIGMPIYKYARRMI
jgi:hypothetical protein